MDRSKIVNEVFNRIKFQTIPIEIRPSYFRVESEILAYMDIIFSNWKAPNTKEYEEFLINTIATQCWSWRHPLTCGNDSSHQLLIPRIDSEGKFHYLCPTCGYKQYTLGGSYV